MDKKAQLHKVQLKLTIVFTLLVFIIAWILQVSYFSFKYLSWVSRERKTFEFISNTINEKNIPLDKLTILIKDEIKLWEARNSDREFKVSPNGKIMNFAILDSYGNVLIQNIRGNIDIDVVKQTLADKSESIKVQNNTIIKYSPIVRPIETYQLLLFKELDYDFNMYISDILKFFIAIWIFSTLFFCIGYIFVRKNLKQVEKNIIEMNDFVHNAGHELKTPLSVIHSNLQLMKQIKVCKTEMLDENLSEINKLNKLIEALVDISDIKQNDIFEINSIKKEIQYILNEFDKWINQKNLTIKHVYSKDFFIHADKEYLYIFLSNIIKNAIKFSHNWWVINISYWDNKCTIQDFWIWIKKENRDKIFNRFFQEDKSRNNEGFWIWLALVSKIANIYKWKISIESQKWEWTKFIINF